MGIVEIIYTKLFVRNVKKKRKYLIKKGAKIGKNTRILSDVSALGSEPYLVEIGDNCLVSSNVTFMTHDGGISVLNNLGCFEKNIMDKLGKIKVGNNVFIGKDATIMPGVTIGDNVVIGLGSIVTKDVESNSVVCGIPAKKIKTVQEYKEDIKDKVYPTGNLTIKDKRKYCEKNM